MIKKLLSAIAFLALPVAALFAQGDERVLFTVQNAPVRVSEFTYIYNKNNQDKADYSEKSLRDYLDLYTKFKLKVQKARDMHLDTLQALNQELDGYRRQLAKSYLEDKEVTDKLVKETFDRMQKDVDVSHIFIACDRNAKPADTLRAYNRAMNLHKMVMGGKSFEQIAADSSEDKSAKENKGALGFITAMLPDGYYNLEKAIYSTQVGSIAWPVRSSVGYHVLRVNALRPARGEMEVSQILVRKGDTPEKAAIQKMRIDSAYAMLQNGAKWEDACAKYSEDKNTATKGGYIGFFGINRYQKSFEDAAFALEKDGDYAKPIETTLGWHIIKRVSRRAIGAFDVMKRSLTERVKRDSRSEIAKQSMITRIKKEGNCQEFPAELNAWTALQVDSIFHTFKWKPNPNKPQNVLIKFGADKTFTLTDFEEYCARSGRDRMRGTGLPVAETVQKLYKSWSDEVTMSFEESQLGKKYPEFQALMREYEDGILLFEALKINVWDRANTDSVGLEAYFKEHLSRKYNWDERARASIYTLKTDDPAVAQKVRDYAAKKPAADVLKKFNKKSEVLTVIEKNYEKGKNKEISEVWKTGAMTATKTDAGTKTASFIKVEEIMPPMPKALQDARGYAVADFQDYLEKQWVDDLAKTYQVKIDESVLKSLIRK